jgi:hypothetical protein
LDPDPNPRNVNEITVCDRSSAMLRKHANAHLPQEVQEQLPRAPHAHPEAPGIHCIHAEAPGVDGEPPFFYAVRNPAKYLKNFTRKKS